MLKADLHLHTKEDPEENIKHTSFELIDYMSKLNFEVISITNHNTVTYNEELTQYAKKRNILLIAGTEIKIKGKEVLLYNITEQETFQIKSFEDIKKLDKKVLIIAPHPFFITSQCLKKYLIEYYKYFDAIEYSHYYLKFINLNKKAEKIAQKYNKPLIGTSDTHYLWQLNTTFTLIDASSKDINSVLSAIKENKIKLCTCPLSLSKYLSLTLKVFIQHFKKLNQKKKIDFF